MTVAESDDCVAEGAHRRFIVGHHHNGAALGSEVIDLLKALPLERDEAQGQHLVDEENVGLNVGGNGERKAQMHAATVSPQPRVDELLQLREDHDSGK